MKRQLREEEVIEKLRKSDWYKSLSDAVKKRVDAYPPTKRYKMKETGKIVTIVSYDEEKNGVCNTVTVDISSEDNNFLLFERQVFGVKFEELEEVNTADSHKN
jgi:hypothetical protein